MVARRLAPEGGFIFPVGRGRFMAASGLQNDVHFLPTELGQNVVNLHFLALVTEHIVSTQIYADYSGLDVEGFSSVRRHLARCGQLGTDSACTGHPFPGCPLSLLGAF